MKTEISNKNKDIIVKTKQYCFLFYKYLLLFGFVFREEDTESF